MEGSKKAWFSAKEVCAHIDMSEHQFRDYVEKRIFPVGVPRGKKLRVWSEEDVAWMIYREKNHWRYDPKIDADTEIGDE